MTDTNELKRARCAQIASAEAAVDFETFDCPTCEGATSGLGVECYRCRGEQ